MTPRSASFSLIALAAAVMAGCTHAPMALAPTTAMPQAQTSLRIPTLSPAERAQAITLIKAKLERRVPDYWKTFRSLDVDPTPAAGVVQFHGVMTSAGFTGVTTFYQVAGMANLNTKDVKVTSVGPRDPM